MKLFFVRRYILVQRNVPDVQVLKPSDFVNGWLVS
jgi:hypothetical protein